MAYRPHTNQPYPVRVATNPWMAPTATDPITATVRLPGSKSMMARALVLSAISEGASTLARPLRARDTELMSAGLRALGVDVSCEDDALWLVRRSPEPLTGNAHIEVGLAGTVMRFLPPLAAMALGPVSFDGDRRARQRPLRPLVRALRSLGVQVETGENDGLPLTVHGLGKVTGGPEGRTVTIDASASSQLVSGLLLAAPAFEHGIVVHHVGPPVPSTPHLRMTVAMLRAAGAAVDDTAANTWTVEPGRPSARAWDIEPDLSGAAPFLAAALVTGGTVTIPDWPHETTQPGDRLRELLAAMGGTPELGPDGLTMRGTGVVTGLDADLSEVGELTPVLAALAALARTPSRFRGVGHIRAHETDRLAALAKELGSLGSKITELPDGLIIEPAPLRETVFETYDDHRMAHAAAVIGLVVPHVRLTDVSCTTKTMPDFPGLWSAVVNGDDGTLGGPA
ncbi:MAG: 3-phosphoshikimate 1-carboxyvinyltransferase [Micromonosporaceae bacterium]|nr:3-phosphoshikimate 1-carboxyvinyltransferase [Micromonosporaceae bacterium]